MPLYEFPMNPISASRPRISKFGPAYFTGPYKVFKERCTGIVPCALPVGYEPTGEPLRVEIHCYVTKPKTTKLVVPKADVDNYAKAILDAMNERLWVDDQQIRDLRITKQWCEDLEREEGYFTVEIEELT